MITESIQTLSPWLDKLDYDWQALEGLGTIKHFEKHHMLYHFGDPVDAIYIVKSGRVRLFLTSYDGREKAIAIIGENGLLGESSLYKPSSHISSAITATPTTVIAVEKDTFKRTIDENQRYTWQLIEIMSWKVHLLSMHSLHLSFGTSLQRLCDALIHLGLTYGEKIEDDQIKITITFTHQELADLIGTTRVTVANHLKDLIAQHIISKRGKYYIIKDMTQLSNMLVT